MNISLIGKPPCQRSPLQRKMSMVPSFNDFILIMSTKQFNEKRFLDGNHTRDFLKPTANATTTRFECCLLTHILVSI